MAFDIVKIRNQFPALKQKFNNKPVIYFDNACVTLRPESVIEAIKEYYTDHPGCHRRAYHAFGRLTTEKFGLAREKIRRFINAQDAAEIVFVRNTTEAINLIAHTLVLEKGDRVLTTEMEHNSNFIPWQVAMKNRGIEYRLIPLNNDLTFNLGEFEKMMDEKVKLVSLFHTSHITGYTTPAAEIIKIAHKHGALVLLDGAQSAAHEKIDVQGLGVDFYVFSFHKMLGPSGLGACYGKKSLLEKMPQFLTGGETVSDVFPEYFITAELPAKFEAGLQDYAGAMGAGAAIEYLEGIGWENIKDRQLILNKLLSDTLLALPEVTILGPADPAQRGNIINFSIKGVDALSMAELLDKTNNIMVRAGMHCAHAWYNRYNLSATLRLSVYFYNTEEEVAVFAKTIADLIRYFY